MIHFSNGRANLDDQTYLFNVTLTNDTGYDLLTPVVLTIDSLGPAGAELEGSLGQQTAGRGGSTSAARSPTAGSWPGKRRRR